MGRIEALLWDIDGTLLNFAASERAGIRNSFAAFGLGPCSDALLEEYSAINTRYWEMLERGECTKRETMIGRFVEFFGLHGISADPEAFNDDYQRRLPETIVFNDDGLAVLKALSHTFRQYAVTNGNRPVQRKKLNDSGMIDVFDGVFISDEVGCEKPSIEYFSHVLKAIGLRPEQTMIIGDSLTSDMLGGARIGAVCCWYNPSHKPLPEDLPIPYVIDDLRVLLTLSDKLVSEADER